MCFNATPENKILAKISKFTVVDYLSNESQSLLFILFGVLFCNTLRDERWQRIFLSLCDICFFVL